MKLLFITYGGGHADLVARIIPYIDQFENISCHVLALSTAGVILERFHIKYKTCADYINVTGYQSALKIGDKLSQPLWHPSSGINYNDSCAYMGVSMCDLIEELGDGEAQKQYAKLGRKVFLPVRFLEKVIKAEAPDVVVTTCNVRMEKAAIIAANNNNIPSLLIDDLFGYSLCGMTRVENCEITSKTGHLPRYIFVLNEFVKNRLLKANFPLHAISVTGQPVFSELRRDLDRLELNERYKTIRRNYEFVVTYAAPGKIDVLKSQLKELKQLVAQKQSIYFILKLHPSTSITSDIQEVLDSFTKNSTVSHKDDVLYSLKVSDVVIVYRSTVGLQAIFSGKKLIIWGAKSDTGILPYDRSINANFAEELGQLSNALDKSLESVSQDSAEENEIFYNTPNALQNIYEAMTVIHESKLCDTGCRV